MVTKNTKPKAKAEFDKESMYSRIMPTAARKKELEAQGIDVDSNEEIDLLAQAQKTLNDAARRKVDTQTAPEASVQTTRGINIKRNQKPVVLINVTEYCVNKRINDAFDKFKGACKCDRCMKDVAAMALNELPPKYMVVEEDQIDAVVDAHSQDVVPALTKAILAVKANPRH